MRLPVQDQSGAIRTATLEIDNSIPVHENQEFATAILYMIASANGKDVLSDMETWLFLEACRNNDIQPKELYDAFWQAQGDEFVGKTGLEFKHLMKHVKTIRSTVYRRPVPAQSMAEFQRKRAEQLQGKAPVAQIESGKEYAGDIQQNISQLAEKMSITKKQTRT